MKMKNEKSNYLKYKKYLGSVDFSEEDNILYGKILGINDLVSYEGTSIKTLEDAFKKAVEDYLTTGETLEKLLDK